MAIRVALLNLRPEEAPGLAPKLADLAAGLAAGGLAVSLIETRRGVGDIVSDGGFERIANRRLPESMLRLRGFDGSEAQAPLALITLIKRRFNLVHAFVPADAVVALAARRVAGGIVAFTCTDPPDRDAVAAHRGTLRRTEKAFGEVDCCRTADEQVEAAVTRWLALEAPVLPLGDPEAHARLYRTLTEKSPTQT